jgi:autotransporter-associated beta strand protein
LNPPWTGSFESFDSGLKPLGSADGRVHSFRLAFDIPRSTMAASGGGINSLGFVPWLRRSQPPPAGLEFEYVGIDDFVAVARHATAWRGDASGVWSSTGNWTGAVPTDIGDHAIFGNVITGPHTVTLEAPRTVRALSFDSPHRYSLVSIGPQLTLDSVDVVVGIDVGRGSHVISAPLYVVDPVNLSVWPGASIDLDGTIRGPEGIRKFGTGSVTIRSANSYAGATDINAGVLRVENGQGLGVGGVNAISWTRVLPGGTLEFYGNWSSNEHIRLSDTLRSAGGSQRLTSTFVLDAFSSVIVHGGSTLQLDHVFTDPGIAGGIHKLGAGWLVLSGANNYGGATEITTGTVRVENGQGLGVGGVNSTSWTLVKPGATLELYGNWSSDEHIRLSDTLRSAGGSQRLTSTLVLDAPSSIIVSGTSTLRVDHVYTDPGVTAGFQKLGAGLLILGGANNYGGATDIAGGIVRVENGQGLGVGGVNSTSWTLVKPGATLELAGTWDTGEHVRLSDTLRSAGGSQRLTNTLVLDANSRLIVDSGSTLQIDHLFRGPARSASNA